MKLTAVLIDTVSIQNYIFSSNRLKVNVGASHIVKNIYKNELIDTLRKIGNGSCHWDIKPEYIPILNNNNFLWEIGYIGGGNALIFFKNEVDAKDFIKNYSKHILLNYPGLNLAFGLCDFDLSDFQYSIKNLRKNLRNNKNTLVVRTTLQKYGFTLECRESNESAEDFKDDDGNYISSVVEAKLNNVEEANASLQNLLSAELNSFQFPFEFEKISPENEQSYIAVVHIDGNSMGSRFELCNDLISLRKLSKSVENATIQATQATVKHLVALLNDNHTIEEIGLQIKQNFLPFRPIIIGGDDITFVCNGKLGIYLAKEFIKNFISQEVSDGKPLSACGGVAIVKTKFPFFKAYQLAEELTQSAKNECRKHKNSSFIDFHISSGGFSGSWNDIKCNHYAAVEGNAHFGPYRIDNDNEENSLKKLEDKISDLINKPKNKVLKLRETILKSKKEIDLFISANEEFNRMKIWKDKKTIYFDAIEVMDFYHQVLFN